MQKSILEELEITLISQWSFLYNRTLLLEKPSKTKKKKKSACTFVVQRYKTFNLLHIFYLTE